MPIQGIIIINSHYCVYLIYMRFIKMNAGSIKGDTANQTIGNKDH
jgi:hypothetical protein